MCGNNYCVCVAIKLQSVDFNFFYDFSLYYVFMGIPNGFHFRHNRLHTGRLNSRLKSFAANPSNESITARTFYRHSITMRSRRVINTEWMSHFQCRNGLCIVRTISIAIIFTQWDAREAISSISGSEYVSNKSGSYISICFFIDSSVNRF